MSDQCRTGRKAPSRRFGNVKGSPLVLHSVDERLLAFVAWHGEIPREATRIEDYRAREHAADWIRRNIGIGVVHSYVIGFELGERWWTLFAYRIAGVAPEGAECWHIEAYDHSGTSWSDRFFFWPETSQWQRGSSFGTDDLGRDPAPA